MHKLINGGVILKIKNKVRNITILLIAFVIFLTPTINNVSEVSASQRFSDVPTTHWAYSHIMNLNNKGVINGYRDGSFGHNDSLTRGQAATLIVKTANIKNAGKKADFSDVSKNNFM